MLCDGSVRLKLTPELRLEELILASGPADLGVLYQSFLQPVLAENFFQELGLDGRLAVDLKWSAETAIRLDLQQVAVRQGMNESGELGRNLVLTGLNGVLHWRSGENAPASRLAWQGGRLLQGIDVGPGKAAPVFSGSRIVFAEPFSLPVMDGELRTESFRFEQAESGPKLRFQGYLTPISMQRLSQALGWPPLSGQLSGMIPGVALEQGRLEVEGILLIRLFGGRMLVKNLNLSDLFGALPVLEADLELHEIDLETLTRTFSFGKITGSLEGRVQELRLEEWRPVSFAAWFATPADGRGGNRISQRAVDNISNLGGAGISGALSRSFLRMFEEFGYDRLGISCRLENGICEMGGIEAAGRGYYLVKGGGIPRIDILGYNHQTDWELLLDKLAQMTEGEAPIIE